MGDMKKKTTTLSAVKAMAAILRGLPEGADLESVALKAAEMVSRERTRALQRADWQAMNEEIKAGEVEGFSKPITFEEYLTYGG